MSHERAVLVRVPGGVPSLDQLVRDIHSAYDRAADALPGERTDVSRYEALSAKLELLALRSLRDGAETCLIDVDDRVGHIVAHQAHAAESLTRLPAVTRGWVAANDVVVELRLPFEPGETKRTTFAIPVAAPAARWSAPPGVHGKKAVEERFRQQVADAISGTRGAAITPSGVPNSVLTEIPLSVKLV
jgi:hypothetical protein